MSTGLYRYASSTGIAFLLLMLVAGIAELPGLDRAAMLWAPGMLAAATVFPQGSHSDWGVAFLLLAGTVNCLLLAAPISWLLVVLKRRRQKAD